MLVGNSLYVVDGTAVRVHAPQNGDRFQLGHVPHEHHSVAIECDRAIIQVINGTSDDISKLSRLALLNFDSAIARL